MFGLLKVAGIALFVLSQWYLSKFLLNTLTGYPETEEDEDLPIHFADRVYFKLHIVLALSVVLLAIVKRDSQLLAYFIVAAFAIFMLSSLIAVLGMLTCFTLQYFYPDKKFPEKIGKGSITIVLPSLKFFFPGCAVVYFSYMFYSFLVQML
ncbi:MAG: hypothetical protein ACOYI9_05030 [Candidatus Hydrogenedentales bacterium]|jgi:hypothetical protein